MICLGMTGSKYTEGLSNNMKINIRRISQAESICVFPSSLENRREFTVKLVSLIRDIRGAIEMHRDLYGRMKNQPEFIKGHFLGIKLAHLGKVMKN
ncbi:hypothetical protein C5167_037281 [Papaver somniferum]|uniref:DUF7794 domain-containing protein n=1 Tax=Papaver somniferum TaxID=3469 RepID=A0A4Y7I922_PAPSO|nr:hypothetical protein C5167_037281 [Papaver somniferum]